MNTPQFEVARQNSGRIKLQTEAIGADDVLYTANTIFPFTLFTDTITIDRSKVTIFRRDFFRVARTTSIQIEDIVCVEKSIGPILGSIKIFIEFFAKKPYVIYKLSRQDTENIKDILQGYVIARQKKIDCSNIPTHELLSMVISLGKENTP